MSVFRIVLVLSLVAACGGPAKTRVPVDSPLRPWEPTEIAADQTEQGSPPESNGN